MLIRQTHDDFECLTQEHHALLSGLLAAEWTPSRLDPLLVHTIGLHDNPWRAADADPTFNPDTGLPHDFITYPMEPKIELYRSGLDQLESVHPWTAYMVSRHYTTFAGTRDEEALTGPEQRRRDRLEDRLDEARLAEADDALAWIKFFDVFSLHLCLTGPRAVADSIPRWLQAPSSWSEAPDGTDLELSWADDTTLQLGPWPFARPELPLDVHLRRLERSHPADAEACMEAWRDAEHDVREVVVEPAR